MKLIIPTIVEPYNEEENIPPPYPGSIPTANEEESEEESIIENKQEEIEEMEVTYDEAIVIIQSYIRRYHGIKHYRNVFNRHKVVLELTSTELTYVENLDLLKRVKIYIFYIYIFKLFIYYFRLIIHY